MFRKMRRNNQILSAERCGEILDKGISGVLAVTGDDAYPYAVPLNYVYSNGFIYFHWAKEGHKLDAIKRNNKVSFCVTESSEVVPSEFTSYFSSVIVFAKAEVATDEKEIIFALKQLAAKYSPGLEEKAMGEIEKSKNNLLVIRLTAQHISGKQAIELAKRKQPPLPDKHHIFR